MSDAPSSADVAGEDWDAPLPVTTMPVLHLEGFDGPMDLLLDLAERQRIDLGKMSIAALAAQFVAAMEQLTDKVSLERRADWLVLATRLVLLRARLLFPKTPEAAAEAEQEEAAELKRLDDRALMRAATAWLQARPQLGIDVLTRPVPKATPEGGYVALMEACLTVLRAGGTAPEIERAPRLPSIQRWTVADALNRIETLLAAHPAGGPMPAFLPLLAKDDPHLHFKARVAISNTFLAGLELTKQQTVTLTQTVLFEDILLSQRLPDL